MAVLTPPPPPPPVATRDTDALPFRIPPVPPLPPLRDEDDYGRSDGNGPMRRVSLPPDRFKSRLLLALFVSVLVNLVFYNQAAIWGKQVRVVFLRALHQQYVPPPAQIILVTPRPATEPGGKTTFTPLAPAPRELASPFPASQVR